jgi:GT2 family glycosyltransferase
MTHVTVVIPCYNQRNYVADAIRSALSQTHASLDVVVIDDGSTDRSGEVVERIAATAGGRVTLLRQDNAGLAAARNRGLAASRGEYVWFLDSDDLLRPSAAAELSARLDARPTLALVCCGWREVAGDGVTVLGSMRPRAHDDLLTELLLRKLFFFASATLLRRSSLERAGGFDARLRWGEDVDLWLRFALAGETFDFHDSLLLDYRVHVASMTAQIDAIQVEHWQRGLRLFLARPDVPTYVRELEQEAWCMLHLESAGRFLRLGRIAQAREQLHAAHQSGLRPDNHANRNRFLDWAAGTAANSRTVDGSVFITSLFESLPEPWSAWSTLCGQARGRFHAVRAFSLMAAGRRAEARPHALRALWGDAAQRANRGLWRLLLG